MSEFVDNVINQAIKAKIEELEEDKKTRKENLEYGIIYLKDCERKLLSNREDIEARLRYEEDMLESISFTKRNNINQNWVIKEIDNSIAELENSIPKELIVESTVEPVSSPEVWIDILLQAEAELIPHMSGKTHPTDEDFAERQKHVLKFCRIYDDVLVKYNLKHNTITKEIRNAGGSKNLTSKRLKYRKYENKNVS